MDLENVNLELIREIVDDDVVSLQDVVDEILQRQLRTLQQLEEFLLRHEDNFFVENQRVALFDPELEASRDRAVDYFEAELERYIEWPHYMNFRGHVGQADDDIKDFINSFYPGEEFKNFLLANPDVFFVGDDDSVLLLEGAAASYFREKLENREDGMYFMNLRGCIGQAPHYLIEYVNNNYPEEQFLQLLEGHPGVFNIEHGYVFLTQND